MITLNELKKTWEEKENLLPDSPAYDPASFEKIIRKRVEKHMRNSMQYFWASFTLQIIVYSLLCHVVVKYWQDTEMLFFGIGGILLFLPFTITLMRKFKKLAIAKPFRSEDAVTSLFDYVLQQQRLLRNFYNFKKWYELFLIPMSIAIGVVLIYKLYVPGGVSENLTGVFITFFISLFACAAVIRSENKKSFEGPIRQLQNVLDEFSFEA